MARLLCKDRRSGGVASEFCCIVTLISSEISHQIRRENVFPRQRLHIIVRAPPLVLSFIFLVREIGHIKPLPIGEDNGERSKLFNPHEVVEGFSKRFFQNGQLWRRLAGAFGGNIICMRSRLEKLNPEFCQARLPPVVIGIKKTHCRTLPILIVVPTGIRIVVVAIIGSVPPILIWVPVITVGRIIIIAIVIIRVSGQPGQCKCGSLHRLWIGWVPTQRVRVLPVPREKFFSYNLPF